MVESVHNRNGNDPSRVTCFCQFCQAKAKARGTTCQRAFEGFKALEAWVRSCRSGQRPTDGYYVTLWRVLFRYPEIHGLGNHVGTIACMKRTRSIYKLGKGHQGRRCKLGWHVWHAHSFSPFSGRKPTYRS